MVTLRQALDALQEIAPLELAEEWDNVGLLLEPATNDRAPAERIFLTVDCTEAVVREALSWEAELVVSYHPPIFSGITRLTQAESRHRALLDLVRHHVAVYSPHTAADAAPGGVNDWLVEAFPDGSARVLQPRADDPEVGQGRLVDLGQPRPLGDVAAEIRAHLGLDCMRVATAEAHMAGAPIRTVALCPGAGGSVVGPSGADLLWTGEMRHHDVLAAVENGRSVVLCEHTNTERGWLGRLGDRLMAELPDASLHLAQNDRDPLCPEPEP